MATVILEGLVRVGLHSLALGGHGGCDDLSDFVFPIDLQIVLGLDAKQEPKSECALAKTLSQCGVERQVTYSHSSQRLEYATACLFLL